MARDTAQVQFDTLVIEGGLFTAEWLGKVASFAASSQTDSDYRVRAGFTLREEIALAWRSAQALWAQFDKARRLADHNAAAVTQRFVADFLQQVLAFTLRHVGEAVEADGRVFPIGHFAFGDTIPVIIGTHTLALDTADTRFGDPMGARRRSAFGLLQEYLNAQNTALWGVASNGLVLRLARDNASLTRPAWLEVDLDRLFTEERFAEFGVLWLLLHATRFGGENVLPSESVLERWRDACRDQGVRARDALRGGVERALLTLGNGFLGHPRNAVLREALATNRLSTREFFQQLLRLVYRQIFLLTIEERGILHPEPSDVTARELYAEGYSLRSLRDRAVRRNAHDRHHDLWEGLKLVWKGLAAGEPRLALPALSGLFAPDKCRDLDGAQLENRHLLLALYHLAWLRDSSQARAPLTRVNWRDMGSEELGSIYESLLELAPQVSEGNRRFAFLQGAETRGNARKTSGSYYTPESLVQVLLDSALEPVIMERLSAHPSGQAGVDALLSITVVDPACGSGHFLLAAARRIAAHLARVISDVNGHGQPTPGDYMHALRQVIGHCIFGVDLNPMAVELCKVSLWLEAVEPGLPLTFLNSHVQQGNALIGATPELMAGGVPDQAWRPIEGDDQKISGALQKRNALAASGQRSLQTFWAAPSDLDVKYVAEAVTDLDNISDVTAAELANKESKWDFLLGSDAYKHEKLVADAWCAGFFWPKQTAADADVAPTNDIWRQVRDRQGHPAGLLVRKVAELAERYQFFHWYLQFPAVAARGGFDVVLGNPPWDSLRLQEKEFFAATRADIAVAATSNERKRLIAELEQADPALFSSYKGAVRATEATNLFVTGSARFPLTGVGRVNLFGLFAETASSIVAKSGRVGQILPSGIVTDDSTKLFFQKVMDDRRIVSFHDFENRDGIFPAVHSSTKFGLLTLSGASRDDEQAEFSFFSIRPGDLNDPTRRFTLTGEDIALLNPLTRTCPVFRTRQDANLTKGIYSRAPVLTRSGWGATPKFPLDIGRESALFSPVPKKGYLPLYEGKHFHQFDHGWSTQDLGKERQFSADERQSADLTIHTRYWYPREEAKSRFAATWKHEWAFVWRDITNATNERSFIAAIVPSMAVAHSAWMLILPDEQLRRVSGLLANVNSFVFDYVVRQKIGGTHMSAFIAEQLPVLSPGTYDGSAPWDPTVQLNGWVAPRILELTYTAWTMQPFARDTGYFGPPFRWDAERRFLIRCELDAAYFHLYGLGLDDVEYVMNTFPIVRRNDERAHGTYRTKEAILSIYERMGEAVRMGTSYATRLDPPAGDSRVAHGARAPEVPATPSVVPAMSPAEEAAVLILALVHANGGSVERIELARAFALRSLSSVLLKLAPGHLSDKAKQWADKRPAHSLRDGQMAAALGALASRTGVALRTVAGSRAVVTTASATPAESKIDEWFRFEARLLLNVLRSLPDEALTTIDSALKGDDRTLLDKAA